ncbi:hypothetical protein BGZ98_004461 [Dissophora globulifera]|nr:hypothetical protein BGZ98_004461 [Dissophora globulifera]
MTTKAEDLPVVGQDNTLLGTKSSGDETSLEYLSAAFGGIKLDNLKTLNTTDSLANTSAVPLPSPPATPSALERATPESPLSPVSAQQPIMTLSESLVSRATIKEWPLAEEVFVNWFNRGQDFRYEPLTLADKRHLYAFARPQVSRDVVVNIRVGTRANGPLVARHVVFPGEEFDELTSCYGPAVKKLIRNAIKNYFEFLLLTQDERMHAIPLEKKSSVASLKGKYTKFLRKGVIYMTTATVTEDIISRIEDEDEQQDAANSVFVKIGFTGDIESRSESYAHDARNGCCITTPNIGNHSHVCFPLLLESILHQVFVYHQVDIPCHCTSRKSKHIEIFRFERLEGESDKDAIIEAEKTVRFHINKWEEALSSLSELHEFINEFHGSHRN